MGNAHSGTVKITDCVAEDSVSVESTYNSGGDKGAGGLVGYGGAAVVIEGSAYEGTVKAPGNAGALAGNCWGTVTVKNSFAVPEMKLCTKKRWTLNQLTTTAPSAGLKQALPPLLPSRCAAKTHL